MTIRRRRRRKVRATADSIVAQLRRGADFAAVAAQFGQGALAREGGNLGWIQEGRGAAEIDRALADLEIGAVSDPIRSADGWHIVRLRDRRAVLSEPVAAVELFLSQVLLPAEPEDTPKTQARRLAMAEEIGASANGCDALRERGESIEDSLSGDLGWVNLRDLPAPSATRWRNWISAARPRPLVTDNGVHVLMVCERTEAEAEVDIRDTVYDRIARKPHGDRRTPPAAGLARGAFVDVRV